jgi:uncharacterized protein (TIGR02246 family)
MMKLVYLLTALIAVVTLSGFASQAGAQVIEEAAVAEIKALNRKLVEGYRAKDVDAIMSVYATDDSLIFFDVTPPTQYIGARGFRKAFENFFAAFPGQIMVETKDLRIEIDGKLAFSHRIDSGYFTDKNGNKIDIALRFTTIYRLIKGKWLITHEHNSVPIDLVTGRPVLFSKS